MFCPSNNKRAACEMSDIIRTNKAVALTSKKPPIVIRKNSLPMSHLLTAGAETFYRWESWCTGNRQSFWSQMELAERLQTDNSAPGFVKGFYLGVLSKFFNLTMGFSGKIEWYTVRLPYFSN